MEHGYQDTDMMRIWIWTLLLCAAAMLAGLLLQRCREEKEHRRTGRHRYADAVLPDTVRTPRILPIAPVGMVAAPAAVHVAARADTALRRTMERSTVITGIERRRPRRRGLAARLRPRPPDSLVVQSITPRGIVVENRYAWEVAAAGEWRIDSAGRLRLDPAARAASARRERRRTRAKSVLRTGGATAAAVGACVLMFLFISR